MEQQLRGELYRLVPYYLYAPNEENHSMLKIYMTPVIKGDRKSTVHRPRKLSASKSWSMLVAVILRSKALAVFGLPVIEPSLFFCPCRTSQFIRLTRILFKLLLPWTSWWVFDTSKLPPCAGATASFSSWLRETRYTSNQKPSPLLQSHTPFCRYLSPTKSKTSVLDTLLADQLYKFHLLHHH